MSGIMSLLSYPFGWIIRCCYHFFTNYGVALIAFATTIKFLLLPLSIKQQKNMVTNSLRTYKLKPKLDKLKAKCGKNKELYNSEMMKLYQEEGINPIDAGTGCVFPIITILILIGVCGVVYSPALHILKIPKNIIDSGVQILKDIQAINGTNSRYAEIELIEAIKQNSKDFLSLDENVIKTIQNFNTTFLGLNLVSAPNFRRNLASSIIPCLTILMQLIAVWQTSKTTCNQNTDPTQAKMMKIFQFIPIVIFAYIYFVMPIGVSFYFMFSNILGIIQTHTLYKKYNPNKAIEEYIRKEEENKKNNKIEKEELKRQISDGVDLSESERQKIFSKKEYNKQKINEARKIIAKKYGENYDDSAE